MENHYGPWGVHAELQSGFDRLISVRRRRRIRRPHPRRADRADGTRH